MMSSRLLPALLAATLSVSAHAATSIAEVYSRAGASEVLSVPFTNPGVATVHDYSGAVEVVVSGTGFSAGPAINDAFYGVPSGVFYNDQYYQLNLGWTGAGLVPFAGEARNANNFITFIEGVGAVTPTATPAYRPDHVYRFVVQVPLAAGPLQFGVSDGNFSDNGGEYRIEVYQLQAVPEPETYAMMLAGLGALAAAARRRRA